MKPRLKAILLVGGMGTRLRPLTRHEPKGLLPVLNKPFLSYQLDLLRKAGVRDVIFAAGKNSKPWQSALKTLRPKGVAIHFAYEPRPLGTGGAIKFAYEALKKKVRMDGDQIVIFNGDVLFDLDVDAFLDFHLSKASRCSIALTRVDDPSRFGVVELDSQGGIIGFIEKPQGAVSTNMINAGAYLFDPFVMERIEAGVSVSIERDTYPTLLEAGTPMFGFPIEGYWNDIGTPATYLQANRDLLFDNNRWTPGSFLRKRGLQLGAGSRNRSSLPVHGRALFGDRCEIGTNVTLGGHVCCGSNVRIGDGSSVQDSVILSGTRIGKNVKISNAIIGKNCRIEDNALASPGMVLGEDSILTAYSRC